MNIIVYKVEAEECTEFTLRNPVHAPREWTTCAEYELPEGYYLAKTAYGGPAIFREANNAYCGLTSEPWFAQNAPILVDNGYRISLKKVRDIPL